MFCYMCFTMNQTRRLSVFLLSKVLICICWVVQTLCVVSTATMGEMELSCRAYVKMYLHCCLFPRCSVNGLLLSSSTTDGAVYVTDCVPLLHSHLSLAPITQLALSQVKPIPTEEPELCMKSVSES